MGKGRGREGTERGRQRCCADNGAPLITDRSSSSRRSRGGAGNRILTQLQLTKQQTEGGGAKVERGRADRQVEEWAH